MSRILLERRPDPSRRARDARDRLRVAIALAVFMTWPLAAGLGRLGRTTTMDGLYGIWNVAWSRTPSSPNRRPVRREYFFPHRDTLAYSESNVLAGVVAIPAWLVTNNAYTAHNTAVLFAFASTFLGTWLLARHLSGNSAAAGVAGILFAFCPYFYSHSAHIQLLMAGGIPLSVLALHRLVDTPSPRRGAVLGVALAGQALACAYYGIFAGLMVGYGVLFFAIRRGLWRVPGFWTAVVIAAATAGAIVLRSCFPTWSCSTKVDSCDRWTDARRYAATWQSYLASPAHGHRPLLSWRVNWAGKSGRCSFPAFW